MQPQQTHAPLPGVEQFAHALEVLTRTLDDMEQRSDDATERRGAAALDLATIR